MRKPPSRKTEAEPVLPIARIRSDQGVVRFSQRTPDGHEIESVILPMGARIGDQDRTWRTLCVSAQIGCGWGCRFCRTARMGLIRNLTVGEIVGQVRAARENGQETPKRQDGKKSKSQKVKKSKRQDVRETAQHSALGTQHFFPSTQHSALSTRCSSAMPGAEIRNVVFMGMGEPLDNFDNVVQAIAILHEDRANQIPRRRITVSTVGRCEGIRRLGALGWRRLKLAVSLNAPNDEIRSRIMPINRIEPMAALHEAIGGYPVRAGGHVLIEYVLVRGINDQPDHARQLVTYLHGLRTCVNLIPYNPCEEMAYAAPDEWTVSRFKEILMEAGQLVFCRSSKGQRALAGCGQLGKAREA